MSWDIVILDALRVGTENATEADGMDLDLGHEQLRIDAIGGLLCLISITPAWKTAGQSQENIEIDFRPVLNGIAVG